MPPVSTHWSTSSTRVPGANAGLRISIRREPFAHLADEGQQPLEPEIVVDEVFRELPMEFAVEARKLLEISREGAVG